MGSQPERPPTQSGRLAFVLHEEGQTRRWRSRTIRQRSRKGESRKGKFRKHPLYQCPAPVRLVVAGPAAISCPSEAALASARRCDANS